MIELIEHSNRLLILLVFSFLTIAYRDARGQQTTPMVRLAKIIVDSSRLEEYKVALKEEAEKSVQIEPGVLTLYAVSEKANPTHFTILEIYADSAAYLAHLQTPHFIKYKTTTKDMVKSLELVEADPLIPEMLIKSSNTTRKRK
ncbi:putative quinol monooxygenase [Chryseolinea sp. H1M3-3]|uniref:putative quinol monooxygenase n=1 Tax=Chryseolinea sp. H1M3-3 TaxID=3034144 RepID=UPI0023EDFD35|nr:putative quinol monooxygenase [Chryseolinea sp. H1M3-3]